MDTIRIVRDLGSVRDLFPDGVETFAEMPYTLFEALRVGKAFARFQEMPPDEAPPRNIWQNEKLLEEHFDEVQRARERKWKRGYDDEQIEDPVDNDAASLLIDEDA